MANDITYQMVTFHLGEELYGVNIMDVKEIVRLQNVRVIPNAPYYVEGIINLRGEIIPIIDLHKRFKIQSTNKSEDIEVQNRKDICKEIIKCCDFMVDGPYM